jgi:hypothetical protein
VLRFVFKFAEAVRGNPEASERVTTVVESSSEEDDVRIALGVGMVAGMLYAAITGPTLAPPALPADENTAPDAPQVD